MIDLQSDLHGVFFGDDFASTFIVLAGAPGVDAVRGILGVADEEQLEGRVMAAVRTLRLPACWLLRAGDRLALEDDMELLDLRAGSVFTVLEPPRRDADGAEQTVLLGAVAP